MKTTTAGVFSLFTICTICFAADLFGQENKAAQSDAPFAEISAASARIQESYNKLDNLAADEKASIATSLQAIEATKLRYDQALASAAQDLAAAESADQTARTELEKLETLRGSSAKLVDENSPVENLSTEAKSLRDQISKTREELTDVDLRMGSRTSTRQSLLTSIEQANANFLKRKEELATLSASSKSIAATARRLELEAEIIALESERKSLLAQQQLLDAEESSGLLRNRKDYLSLRLQRDETRLQQIDEAIAKAQIETAREMAASAASDQSEISRKYPALSLSYALNTLLAEKVQSTETKIQTASLRQDILTKQLKKLQKMRRETSKRVDSLGLTNAIGALLRKQKAELSLEMPTRAEIEDDRSSLNEIEYDRFELEELRTETSAESLLEEIETNIDRESGEDDIELLRSKASEVSFEALLIEAKSKPGRKLFPGELDDLKSPIEDLVDARRQRLSSIIDALDRYYAELLDIQVAESNLVQQTRDYREYINERILWIRSNKILFSQLEIDDSDVETIRSSNWIDAGRRVLRLIRQNPGIVVTGLLLVCGLFFAKPKLRKDVDLLGAEAAKGSCDSSWPTIHAIVITFLLALSAPMLSLLAGLGMFWASPSGSVLFDSIGTALLATSFFAIPMEVLRRMCRKNGVAKCHFYWPNSTIDRLRKHLDQLAFPGAALVFAVVLLHSMDATHRVDLVERIIFVLSMALLGYFLFLTFSPENGIFSSYLSVHEKSWANQTSTLWFALILLVPTSLAGLAIWGFYYSALNLTVCLYVTLVFGLTVEVARALIRRLILLSRRRVHIANAKKKRELQVRKQKEVLRAREEARNALAKAKSDPKSEIDPESLMVPASVDIPTVESLVDLRPANDIDENALRAKKLLSLVMIVVWAFGLWVIWSDVLPALKKLDSITVWSNNAALLGGDTTTDAAIPLATVEGSGADSESITQNEVTTRSTSSDVTVGDLLNFLAIALLTLVSARNLPGAIEMLFLDQLPIDRSFRYATKALVSYAIVMLGMILAFNALSITWDKVQWLATALTFGLAFGLQEIFANFVAGIILMFERPIRIGDLVTVDDQTGLVSKIRTRATTVVNFDRKEYVIPNRDFITGRFVNWTLSDAINRIVFTVGIAYGADVLKAKRILLEVCNNHPKTISDPPTSVVFDLFGDSCLNLTVRTFLAEVDCRLSVTDDLHTQINQAFKEAGIEISFPQRDLHIRSFDISPDQALSEMQPKENA